MAKETRLEQPEIPHFHNHARQVSPRVWLAVIASLCTGFLIFCAIVAYVLTAVSKGYEVRDSLADKPWVNTQIIDARKYTDEQIATVRKDQEEIRKEAETIRRDAFEHSDRNRKDIENDMIKAHAALQDEITATVTKTNLMLDRMQRMTDDAYSDASKYRSRQHR